MMFGHGKRQEQPKEEPTIVEQGVKEVDTNTLCRACSDGYGDGMCSYHLNHGRRLLQRWEKLDSHWNTGGQ